MPLQSAQTESGLYNYGLSLHQFARAHTLSRVCTFVQEHEQNYKRVCVWVCSGIIAAEAKELDDRQRQRPSESVETARVSWCGWWICCSSTTYTRKGYWSAVFSSNCVLSSFAFHYNKVIGWGTVFFLRTIILALNENEIKISYEMNVWFYVYVSMYVWGRWLFYLFWFFILFLQPRWVQRAESSEEREIGMSAFGASVGDCRDEGPRLSGEFRGISLNHMYWR